MVRLLFNLEDRRDPPIETEFNLQAEIASQVDLILKHLGVPQDEQHKYSLVYEKKALNDQVSQLPLLSLVTLLL